MQPIISTQLLLPQRLILLIPLAVIGISLTSHFLAPVDKINLQYEIISFNQVMPAGDAASLQFDSIEKAIRDLEVEPSTTLKTDEGLESALRSAAEPFIPTGLSSEAIERAKYLIKKDLAEPAATQFGELFEIFLPYLIAENKMPLNNPGSSIDAELKRHHELIALRERYLGSELTKNFYHGQHLLAGYFLDRRRIKEDTSLTEAEREQQAKELQEIFSKAIAEPNE